MSRTFRFITSVGLKPVSRLIFSLVANIVPEFAIIISNVCFVGILIWRCSGLYFGIVHCIL